MNLVEIWVSNITMHVEEDGLHRIKADFNCSGRIEKQSEKYLTESEYRSIKDRGYYLG